jgi:1-acyl-sn-glycerol-3-phosphate acyltransferase
MTTAAELAGFERAWRVLRRTVGPLVWILLRPRVTGRANVPTDGPVLIVSNHESWWDIPALGWAQPRAIRYMAKQELYGHRLLAWLLRWGGAFGVRRGEADRDALRVARWLLREGHMIGMFVEGTRQRLGHPGPVLPGGVMLAMQEGVPILPVGIETFGWRITNRKRCCVVFGEPFRLDHLPCTGKGYRQGADILEPELHRLWRLASRAIADGFPDVLPDGTRRSKPMTWRTSLTVEARPWPDDEWAREPLGPIYRPNRYPAGPAATG